MRIEILMSAYNGERYLEEQLDSLLAQSHADYHITIRDDGSRDGSVRILEQYQSLAPDRISIIVNEGNLGYPDCFWELLARAPQADMYAYCDQDDVWDRDKLRCCAERCANLDPTRPVLYVHDYQICDGALQVYEEHHLDAGMLARENIYRTIYFVLAPGFSMILNDAMRRRLLRDPLMKKNIPHDRWTIWCGIVAGEVIHDERMLVKYRRHEATVTQTGKSTMAILKEWWREDVLGDRLAGWSKIAVYFADCYRSEMARIDGKCYEKWRFIAGGGKGIADYFRRLFMPCRLKPTLAGEIVLRLCFAMNKK